MKKYIMILILSMLIVASAIFGFKKLYSSMEDCNPDDYLVGGEGKASGCFPGYCWVSFLVWHYTAEFEEGEEIWMHWTRDHETWNHDMLTFDGEDSLCLRFWCGGPEPRPETRDVWYVYFTCTEHNGNNGRDPNTGEYVFVFENDCSYSWTPPE